MILNISSYLYVPTSLGKIISLIMGMGIMTLMVVVVVVVVVEGGSTKFNVSSRQRLKG